MVYQNEIIKLLTKSVSDLYPDTEVNVNIEIPPDNKFGDYTTHVAMDLCKILKKPPFAIAEEIASKIPNKEYIKKIEVFKPGFINIFLDQKVLAKEILKKITNKGTKDENLKNTKIVIEHTSVNPNKAMHVGHIRNAILGDCLNRLFKSLGYNVEIHNYIDDTGIQVADTTNAVLSLNKKQLKGQRYDDFAWDIYTEINKLYEQDENLLKQREAVSKDIEDGNNETAKIASEIVNKIVDNHLELMADFNIFYDLLVYESDVIKFGFWEKAFEQLKKSPNFVHETEGTNKGCWVLKYSDTKFGDKIFVRSNGTKVYTAKDTAYHLWKFGLLKQDFKYLPWHRKFRSKQTWKTDFHGEKGGKFGKADKIINVIDERQTYPQEMVKYALKSLGFEKSSNNYDHLAYGVVSLSPQTAKMLGVDISDNKSSYAMSGRKGIGVKARDLLELLVNKIDKEKKTVKSADNENVATSLDVAVGALKHYMLKSNPSSSVTFDYEQAVQLTGNTGPYLQYSHARASGILRSAGKYILTYEKPEEINDQEMQIIKLLNEWHTLKEGISESLNVSQLAEYAFRLSSGFHGFYESNIVLKSPKGIKEFRLTIVHAYRKVIAEVLEIMGIFAPDKM